MAEESMNRDSREKADIMARLAQANKGMRNRVREEGMEVDYSPDEDYLRITIGRPRESLSISTEDSMDAVFLYDPTTFEITAVEAPFFVEKFKKESPKGQFWHFVFTLIQDHGPTVYIPGDAESERAEEAFGNLVLA